MYFMCQCWSTTSCAFVSRFRDSVVMPGDKMPYGQLQFCNTGCRDSYSVVVTFESKAFLSSLKLGFGRILDLPYGAMWQCSMRLAITPPKVNQFGSNLEHS